MDPFLPPDGTGQGEGEEDRPTLVVNFSRRCKVRRTTASRISELEAARKYRITSLHLPVEHHYVDQSGDEIPPRIASVDLYFFSMEEFAKYTFAWRKNHQESSFATWRVAYDSHPTVEGVGMLKYTKCIACFNDSNRYYWNAWITVSTRDLQPRKLPKELSDAALAAMFNKDTCVCMEAFYYEPSANRPLSSERRVFVKYPAARNPPETAVGGLDPDRRFCVNRDKVIQFEDPELYKVIEENIERQLFSHESGDNAIQLLIEPDDVEHPTPVNEPDRGRGTVRGEMPTQGFAVAFPCLVFTIWIIWLAIWYFL